jgi:hypothetical protein
MTPRTSVHAVRVARARAPVDPAFFFPSFFFGRRPRPPGAVHLCFAQSQPPRARKKQPPQCTTRFSAGPRAWRCGAPTTSRRRLLFFFFWQAGPAQSPPSRRSAPALAFGGCVGVCGGGGGGGGGGPPARLEEGLGRAHSRPHPSGAASLCFIQSQSLRARQR